MFSHTVENFEVIAEVPRPLLSAMAVDRLDAQIIFCCVLYVVDIVTTGLVWSQLYVSRCLSTVRQF